jgi:hypothetical protein
MWLYIVQKESTSQMRRVLSLHMVLCGLGETLKLLL